MEITPNPRLFLDGKRGMTRRGAVDEFGFFLQDEKNDPDTVPVDTAKPAIQRQNENASLLSRSNETATVGQQQDPILDRSYGATTPGPVDESYFFMGNARNGSGPAIDDRPSGQRQSEDPRLPPRRNERGVGQTPALILDGSRGTAALGLVDESGFFRDAESGPVPTVVEGSRPASQEQSGDPSTSPGFPSPRLPETITTEHEILLPEDLEILGLGSSGYVCKCPRGFAYKVHVSQREVDLMKAAGDCSVTPLSRVMREVAGVLVPSGLVMELATPFDFKLVPAEERKAIKEEMVSLVERLHSSEIGLVHGDIKPANFLRCRDGKLRLCDFDSARLIADEEAEGWEGFVSERYVAPSRGFPEYGPPTVGDDNYALAISVWELFTGKDALIDEDMEEVLKYARTVDVDELEDDDIREFVRNRLRDGGAKV